jgi:hypothetical protein
VEVERVEAALAEIESQPQAMEAVQAIVAMYGEGFARIVRRVDAEALLGDELVEHLLLLHDLHPLTAEERVLAALQSVAADGEVLSVSDGVARVRVSRPPDGEAPDVEAAVRDAAPEVEDVVVEEAVLLPVVQVVSGS